jgi:hypothetical protein
MIIEIGKVTAETKQSQIGQPFDGGVAPRNLKQ